MVEGLMQGEADSLIVEAVSAIDTFRCPVEPTFGDRRAVDVEARKRGRVDDLAVVASERVRASIERFRAARSDGG
jgi:hypothetical protein